MKLLSLFVIIVIISFIVLTISLSADFGRLTGLTKEDQTNEIGYTTYFNSIRPFEAHSLIYNNFNLTILDVRECECAYDRGHLPKAIWSDDPENFYRSTNDLLIYCDNGTDESLIFLNKLINHTYGSMYHLEGGIQAWIRAGFTTII